MVILGAVKANFWVGGAAALALILGAAYTLWMFKRVYLGPVANDHVKALSDISSREFLVLALLAIAVLAMGLYPRPLHRCDGHLRGRVAQACRAVQAELTRLN